MSLAQDVREQYRAALGRLESIALQYFINGQFENGFSVLEHGLTLFGASSVPDAYTQLQLTYGHILLWQSSLITGDYARPVEVLQNAVQRAVELGNETLLARAYDTLGFCLYQRALTGERDFALAAQYFERAVALWERLGHTAGICTARFHVGLIAERAGQFEAAVAQFRWVHTTARDHNLFSQQAEASRHLAFAAMRSEDYEQALGAFQEALTLLEAQHSELFLPFAYLSVGEVYQSQGKYAEAHHYYTRGAQKAAALGVKRASVQILYCLGEVSEEQEQRQSAYEYYTEAHEIAQDIQFQLGIQMTAAKVEQFRATE
jgi:tetratricopeptide (TPR) repeat protein